MDRETRAWDTKDVDLLLSLFHPDFVWSWPARYDAHDPAEWRLVLGRFDEDRWHAFLNELFSGWDLLHNRRATVEIEISDEEDGALAVVDIDTCWRRRDGSDEMRWKGRVCKVYSLVAGEWKITMHTGALEYPGAAREAARKWADTWARAWPEADAAAISALYAQDAVFYSHPFRDRQDPEDYVEWTFADQAQAECRFGEPVVEGDRAAVDWWGVITAPDGSIETIAGSSLLRFDEHGLVVEQRDAWAAQGGRNELQHWAPARAGEISSKRSAGRP